MAESVDLLSSISMLLKIVGVYGVLKILLFIYLLIIGSVAQVAIGGTIDVPAAINTAIGTQITNTATQFAAIDTGLLFIFGLLSLVVIMKVFSPLLQNAFGKKKAAKKSSGGFM